MPAERKTNILQFKKSLQSKSKLKPIRISETYLWQKYQHMLDTLRMRMGNVNKLNTENNALKKELEKISARKIQEKKHQYNWKIHNLNLNKKIKQNF